MGFPGPSLRFRRPPVSYLLEHGGLDHKLVGFEQLGEHVLLPERRLQIDVFGPVEACPDGASAVGFFHGETLEKLPRLIQRSAFRADAETPLFFQAPNIPPRASPTLKNAASRRCKSSRSWAMAITLSGTVRNEPSCPTNVAGRSALLRNSSKAPRRMRQTLPIFMHGSRPSLHHR